MKAPHNTPFDLNLLRVFDAVFEEGGVSRAGRRLGLTQSAVSHALRRLRDLLGDDLFVRGPQGVRPTARARQIAPRVHAALGELQAVTAALDFDPATSDREFTLMAATYGNTLLAPPLVSRLLDAAPVVRLKIVEYAPHLAEHLDTGGADFLIGGFDDIPARIGHDVLLTDTLVWVVRRGHPLAGRISSLDDLVRTPHVQIASQVSTVASGRGQELLTPRSSWQDFGALETALAARGLRRQVGVTVPDSASAMAVVVRSDMAALLPRRLASLAARNGQFHLIDPPYEIPLVKLQLLYRRNRLADPATAWMRDQILQVAAAV